MYPYVKLVRVDCSQLNVEVSANPAETPTPTMSEEPNASEKPPGSVESTKVPEPESDIESNNGSSFCDPIDTPHFESDSEPVKESESKSEKIHKNISPKKLVTTPSESPNASKTADPRSIDSDGKLVKFFRRNPYPKRTHIVNLGKFYNKMTDDFCPFMSAKVMGQLKPN